MSSRNRVAVVGAGVSGATVTRILVDNGVEVDCYEKSRGSGGRGSTKRVQVSDGSTLHFDHGAQYFTARNQPFRQFVRTMVDRGRIRLWKPTLGVAEQGAIRNKSSDTRRYVPTPGMSSLASLIFGETEPGTNQRVEQVITNSEGLKLDTERGETSVYEAVIVTAPPRQSAEIVESCSTRLAEDCHTVNMKPVWAVLLDWNQPLAVDYDALFVNEGALDWVAKNSHKPRRPDHNSWVLHSTTNWAENHLEIPEQQVINRLLDELSSWLSGVDVPAPRYSSAHRWRYAHAVEPREEGVLVDKDTPLVVAGDWLHGNRIEGAFMSGREAASGVLSDVLSHQSPTLSIGG